MKDGFGFRIGSRGFVRRAALLAAMLSFGLAMLAAGAGPVAAENWLKADTISAGAEHSCAVRMDGQVLCWGKGDKGQLGDGQVDPAHQTGVPVKVVGVGGTGLLDDATAVSAGKDHSCAIRTNGHLACWGDNTRGKLGDGTTTSSGGVPVEVLNEAGDAPLTGVVQVSAARYNTCAVADTGRPYCWGSNLDNQLGDSGGGDSSLPIQPYGIGSLLLGNATSIAAGTSFACAVYSDNTDTGLVACWGHKGNGQVGNGTWGGPPSR